MEINQNAPVKQEKQIFIQAAPDKVWGILANLNSWVNWNKKITKVALEGEPAKGKNFIWKVNGAKIKSQFHTVERGKSLGWSGTTFGGSAIHNWYLENKDGGTVVKVEESMQGWLVSLFKGKMNKVLAEDMQYWLEQLKTESEK